MHRCHNFTGVWKEWLGPSRRGNKNSGISGHIRGWSIGARVEMTYEDGKDVCRVYRTGGSGGRLGNELISEFSSQKESS